VSRTLFSSRNASKGRARIAAAFLVLTLSFTLLSLPTFAQRGFRVQNRNLAELTSDARTILYGRVLSVRSEPHPQYANMMTVAVTLEVFEVLKGQAPATFSFRQYVVDQRDAHEKLGYKVGQEVFLMLTGESAAGLSSPAGMEQGRFRVQLDAQGNRMLVNGQQNMGLFQNIDKAAPKFSGQLAQATRQLVQKHTRGPIPYTELKSMIQTLIANQ
jgi:hypothetical protein